MPGERIQQEKMVLPASPRLTVPEELGEERECTQQG